MRNYYVPPPENQQENQQENQDTLVYTTSSWVLFVDETSKGSFEEWLVEQGFGFFLARQTQRPKTKGMVEHG